MSKFIVKAEHIPNLVEYPISTTALRECLKVLNLNQAYLWDSKFFFVSHEDWGRVFGKVLLNLPKYVAEKFDCEQYALLVTARVGETFKLNTCGIAIGQSPMGYHGFNIFLSEHGLFYLEPQTGEVFSIEEDSGYKAEIVIFG